MKNIYLNHKRQHHAETYKLYTDGTKTEKGVASAAYNENFSTSKRVSNCTRIIAAELYGILDAKNYNANAPKKNIHLATDYKSSLQQYEHSSQESQDSK